ncbi:MAG: c-type cytochrome [Pseudomonas sp.]|nr:c-type cytochrome [Pseudomonas sp.]
MKIPSRALAGAGALILALQVHAADGQKIYSQGGANPAALACVTCHGANGEGMAAGGFPRLAGLSAAYMRKQLEDIRSGARSAPVMQPLAAALTDEEIAAVTEMLAALPAVDVPLVTRVEKADDLGAQLALRGAWARNIPECVSCHGPSGIGVGDAFPALAGQPAQYIAGQLQAWRQGTRKNDPNDLMGHVARGLTDAEVQAVSEYFANLSQP